MTVINIFDKKPEDPNIKELLKDYVEDKQEYEAGVVILKDTEGSLYVSTSGFTVESLYYLLGVLQQQIISE